MENYKDGLSVEQGTKLGLTALKKALGTRFNKERTDISVITKDGYRALKKSEIEKHLKK